MPPQALCDEILTSIFEYCLVPTSESKNALTQAQITGKKFSSPSGTLCSASRVSRSWNRAATKILYSDPGEAISRYEGLYLPHLLRSLAAHAYLRKAVRSLTITATMEAGLWVSEFAREGDLFCELVERCPRLRAITLPSFEVACRDRIVSALQSCVEMQSFNIRVYLESSRRDPRFAKVIPYDSWSLQLVGDLLPCWPNLQQFSVRHIPDNSYHLIPDVCLKPPKCKPYMLPAHAAILTSLSLRETFIDDAGLFHLLQNSALTSLCIMSCQGITSSYITRQGLLDAIKLCGSELIEFKIMVPWLPYSAKPGEPDMVVERALKHCPKLKSLCVAGYDHTNAFIHSLPNPKILEELEIMDFELLKPDIIFDIASIKSDARLPNLKRLGIWQRNAGVGRARVSNGWFRLLFARGPSSAIASLSQRGIALATGWESRLISGSTIDYHHPSQTAQAFNDVDRLSPI